MCGASGMGWRRRGAAGVKKGRAGDLGVRARIGRPARSPGRESCLAVARPGEAGETELAGGPGPSVWRAAERE